ncbi:TonB-dependent receptor [Altererythrobacter marinus]|uniref:TonB-dependent receptor n=1 Tax=Pelagerythrobacter marinus TaxID=538382 RepID=A0ABW9URE1_9SPHN|nr:TonB-dependent receptor [Pelagerythrobacter marinus]MXO67449.1 TonB-dependent receptor [Pelagerythrobacter marinus]
MKKLGPIGFLTGASLVALAQPAAAQEEDEAPAGAEMAAAGETPLAPGEIIVTAQRREQSQQDVPLSISVVSSEALDQSNLTTIADVQFLAPGVNYNANFGGGFNIRGVGTQSLLMSAEQSVALVIDDVIQGLPEVSFAGPSYQSLVDIERIEVLKGPQGTLFGKNSSAGVIQIITANPRLGERTLEGSLSYATKDEINVETVVNLPLGETAALRVAGGLQRRDGFVQDLFSGKDRWAYQRYSLRGKLLWEPATDLSVLLTGEYRYLTDNANGLWTFRNCGSGFGAFSPCETIAPYGIQAGPRNLEVATDGESFTRQKSYTFSGRVDYDLGNATLTSITAYRHLRQPIALDTDVTPRAIYSRNENISGGTQFTQELRVNGDAGILNYTLGGFFYDSRPFQKGMNGGTLGFLPDNADILVSLNAIGPYSGQGYASWVKAKIRSYALFGQVEAAVSPNLTLIAGGRYTHDNVRQQIDYFDVPWLCQVTYAFGQPCHGLSLPLSSGEAQVKASKFTYKLTAKYDITPDVNVYATYATGYKGPMISHPANQPQLLLRPELSKSYEVGLKAELFDRAVAFNLALFKVDYDDFQGQQRVGVAPTFYYTTTNAGGLRTKGVEADLAWRVTPDLTVVGNLAYIPTEFTEFAVQCYDRYTNPATTPGECNYIQPGLPADAPPQFNAAGYPLMYSPKWTWGLRGDYETDIGNDLTLGASASFSYRSSTYGVVADPNSINPGYGLLNGQLSIGRYDDRWRLSLFARNLLDKYFVAGIFRTPLDSGTDNSTPLSTIGYSNIPAMDSSRTVGVKLSYSFGN